MGMTNQPQVPPYQELIQPTFDAIKKLGGSASVNEIVATVAADLRLPQSVLEIPRTNKGYGTLFEHRLAWARTYLKMAGLINNSERAVWSLTPEGANRSGVNGRDVVQEVTKAARGRQTKQGPQRHAQTVSPTIPDESELPSENDDTGQAWREKLLETLSVMPPESFERLCQRILRESGFIEVEVTGRSGDGGIDGRGVVRIAGLISFNVLFQSKRYAGAIGPSAVRDFRGAMIGRADKGLIITTGSFTRDARREAIRDGSPPIDLIDGELLPDKLKDLKLGVTTELVESVEIDTNWFKSL